MADTEFTLEVYDSVRVYAKDLKRIELTLWPPFQHWASTLTRSLKLQEQPSHPFHDRPYRLKTIKVESYTRFGTRIGFLKLFVDVSTADNEARLPGAVFLRGPAVAMLVVLIPDDACPLSQDFVRRPEDGLLIPESSAPPPGCGVPLSRSGAYDLDEAYVLLTVQPRIPAGSLAFVELPAGMMDGGRNFAGVAAKEIREELGIVIGEEQLTCLTDRAADIRRERDGGRQPDPAVTESIPPAMYPSAGGCDEYVKIFSHERRAPRAELQRLQGRLTGLRGEGEMITLKVVRLADLWLDGATDAKALAAVTLYSKVKQWEEQQRQAALPMRMGHGEQVGGERTGERQLQPQRGSQGSQNQLSSPDNVPIPAPQHRRGPDGPESSVDNTSGLDSEYGSEIEEDRETTRDDEETVYDYRP